MSPIDEDDIPAFLKHDRDVDDILNDIEDDDDAFDFPTLDDDDDDFPALDADSIADETYQANKEAEADAADAEVIEGNDIIAEAIPEERVSAKPTPTGKPAKKPAVTTNDPAAPAPAPEELSGSKTPRPGSNEFGADQLRAFVERIERLEEEKATIAADIRDVMAEAKGTGFNPKTIRTVVRLRKKDKTVRDQEQEELDLYLWSLGMAA